MTELLPRLGHALLFTIPPGVAFVGGAAGVIAVLAAVRLVAANTGPVRTWLHVTRTLEHVAITVLLISMVLLSLLQIVLRNVLETGFAWVDPLLRHAVLWLGFMGAALASAQDRHIAIDVLSRLLHGRLSWIVHGLLRLLAAGVSLLLANSSYLLLRDEFEFETRSFLDIPTWVLMIVMPAGFIVIAYRFLVSAWRGRPGPVPAVLAGVQPPEDDRDRGRAGGTVQAEA